MTTYTRTDLVNRTYQYSALVGAEETPSSADFELASNTLADLIDTLNAKDIRIKNGSIESVPGEYMVPLANYGALYLRMAFGGGAPTKPEIDGAELVLRELGAQEPTGTTLKAEYF